MYFMFLKVKEKKIVCISVFCFRFVNYDLKCYFKDYQK